MFAGANVQYVSQNGVLLDIMTQLGILLENAHAGMFRLEPEYQSDFLANSFVAPFVLV